MKSRRGIAGGALAVVVVFVPTAPQAQAEDPAKESLAGLLRDEVARPGGLVADEAARRAANTSRDAVVRNADAETARTDIDRAELGWYPRVTLGARYTRLSDVTPPAFGPSDGSLVGTSATPGPLGPGDPLVALPSADLAFPVVLDQGMGQLGVTVPVSDYFLRVPQARDAARGAVDAAERGAEAARRGAAASAKLAYYAWASARLQGVVARQAIAQAREHLALVEAARDGGRANQGDVLRAESALAQAELLQERIRNAERLGEARLRTLMHDTRGVRFEIGEDLLAPATGKVGDDVAPLVARASDSRPEFRALDANRVSLAEQREVARAGEWPRLDAFANGYLANPSPRVFPQTPEWRATWDVGLQLSWSPNDFAGASPQVRALDARRARLTAEREAFVDGVRDELTAALLALRESEAAVPAAERALAAAEEAHRVRRELYALGRGTSVELLDAETDVLRARLAIIQAHIDARVARVRLAHASGE